MDQRVGMPMYLSPLVPLAAKDPRHSERQVLVRQTADPAMLPFDHHQQARSPEAYDATSSNSASPP